MKKYTIGGTNSELEAAATKRNSAHMLPVSDWSQFHPEKSGPTGERILKNFLDI